MVTLKQSWMKKNNAQIGKERFNKLFHLLAYQKSKILNEIYALFQRNIVHTIIMELIVVINVKMIISHVVTNIVLKKE